MNKMNKWYIYGAGGLGLETVDILQDAMNLGSVDAHTICFVEDAKTRDDLMGYPICDLSEVESGSSVTVAVGEPQLRKILREKATLAGLVLKSIVSPRAFVSSLANVGEGSIIAPFCSVQARACIAGNVSINTMTIVGHDVRVQEGAVLSSMVNLGGGAKIGQEAFIGMGALVKEKVTIGNQSIVAMGSVVFTDLPEEIIAVGNPARVSRRNEEKKVFKG